MMRILANAPTWGIWKKKTMVANHCLVYIYMILFTFSKIEKVGAQVVILFFYKWNQNETCKNVQSNTKALNTIMYIYFLHKFY
jgi:hypothetical protein